MVLFTDVARSIIHVLFPPLCVGCRREGTLWCDRCRTQLNQAEVITNGVVIPGVDQVLCRGSYDLPALGAIVTSIKYHGWTTYASLIPALIAPIATKLTNLPSNTWVIPIPLHARRERWRGFNQATLIAGPLAAATKRPMRPVLRRQRMTKPQATLTERHRTINVHGAFRLRPGVERVARCGILVDDVITTGHTVRECASVLRQSGMERIIAVALAKG